MITREIKRIATALQTDDRIELGGLWLKVEDVVPGLDPEVVVILLENSTGRKALGVDPFCVFKVLRPIKDAISINPDGLVVKRTLKPGMVLFDTDEAVFEVEIKSLIRALDEVGAMPPYASIRQDGADGVADMAAEMAGVE